LENIPARSNEFGPEFGLEPPKRELLREGLDSEQNCNNEAITEVFAESGLLAEIESSVGILGCMSEVNLSAGEAQLFSTSRIILTAYSEVGGKALDATKISGTKPGRGASASSHHVRLS